jgi:hypothetical protein
MKEKITCFVFVRLRKERKTTQFHFQSHCFKKLVTCNVLNFPSWVNWPWLKSLTAALYRKKNCIESKILVVYSLKTFCCCSCRGNKVRVVTKLQVGRLRNVLRSPVGNNFPFSRASGLSLGVPQPSVQWPSGHRTWNKFAGDWSGPLTSI